MRKRQTALCQNGIVTYFSDSGTQFTTFTDDLATLDETFATNLATHRKTLATADAADRAALWNTEETAVSTQHTAESVAWANMREVETNVQATTTTAFATTVGTPWAQFRSNRATTLRDSWTNTGKADYLAYAGDLNTPRETYTSAFGAAYTTSVDSRVAEQVAFVTAQSAADKSQRTGAADVESAHAIATIAAETALRNATAAADHQLLVDNDATAHATAHAAAHATAIDAYHTAMATAQNTRSVELATNQKTYVDAVHGPSGAGVAFQLAVNQILRDFDVTDINAQTTKTIALADRTATYDASEAQTNAAAMVNLVFLHPDPWSQYESDSAAAWGDLTNAKSTAEKTRDTSTAVAWQDENIAKADAQQAHADATTSARATQQSAEQQANVDAATARAANSVADTIHPTTTPEPLADAGLNTNPTIPGAPLLETRPGYTQSPTTTNFHGTGLLGCVGPDSEQAFFNRYRPPYLTEPIASLSTDDNNYYCLGTPLYSDRAYYSWREQPEHPLYFVATRTPAPSPKSITQKCPVPANSFTANKSTGYRPPPETRLQELSRLYRQFMAEGDLGRANNVRYQLNHELGLDPFIGGDKTDLTPKNRARFQETVELERARRALLARREAAILASLRNLLGNDLNNISPTRVDGLLRNTGKNRTLTLNGHAFPKPVIALPVELEGQSFTVILERPINIHQRALIFNDKLPYRVVGLVPRHAINANDESKMMDKYYFSPYAAKRRAQGKVAGDIIGSMVVPGHGEYLDFQVIFDYDSTFGERLLCLGSLALSVVTFTASFNAGAFVRHADEITETALRNGDEVADWAHVGDSGRGLIGLVKPAGTVDGALQASYTMIAETPQMAKSIERYNKIAKFLGQKPSASIDEIVETLGKDVTFSKVGHLRSGVFLPNQDMIVHGAEQIYFPSTKFWLQGNPTTAYGQRVGRHELLHIGAALRGQGDTVFHEIAVQAATTPEVLVLGTGSFVVVVGGTAYWISEK